MGDRRVEAAEEEREGEGEARGRAALPPAPPPLAVPAGLPLGLFVCRSVWCKLVKMHADAKVVLALQVPV